MLSEEIDNDATQHIPIARTTPTLAQPVSDERLAELVEEFAGMTVGQRYLGPGWVNDDGIPCIIFIAYDNRMPQQIRKQSQCTMIAWRWNTSPSTPLSLTINLEASRPHVRWMRSSNDPVVTLMRKTGHFLMTVANVKGQHSGWHNAFFFSGTNNNEEPSVKALEHQWTFTTPGIPYSNINVRFDSSRREPFNDDREDEIPLWMEPVTDFWAVLHHDGPWAKDLQTRDRARIAWARQALAYRGRAAGHIRTIIDRQQLDGLHPVVNSDGMWLLHGPVREQATILVNRVPLIGRLLADIAGPSPDPKAAYDRMFDILHEPYAIFCFVDKLIDILLSANDIALMEAVHYTFDAVLRDSRITKCGSRRPWLANTLDYSFDLKTISINMDTPIEDLNQLWSTGLEMIDLIDMGLKIDSHDFPVPFDKVCEILESVSIEGSIEEAESKVQTLIQEAQDARQWSIPWGARVEVDFAPFQAVRIFEIDGEFSCYFLDDQDRYFHIAVGLRNQPPRIATNRLIRKPHDNGEWVWNEDAEVSLKLIAAAIVRDFVVVEERESLFSARRMRKRIRGRKVKTVIYLPRVRYTTPYPKGLHVSKSSTGRSKHKVAAHLRKAGTTSAAQRFLAQRYGLQIPKWFTFVRSHERGTATEESRIEVYRSRSASKMIFNEVDKTPEGTRPAWFEFEKDCARLLSSRGMHVIHQAAHRDGDGGVDLFATDSSDQTWVVQCKCWAPHRSIGPEIIRELEGAIRLVDKGSSIQSRGIIITTSSFTEGAVSGASSLGFELIDGPRFTELIATT